MRKTFVSKEAKREAVFVEGVRTAFVKSFGVFEDCDSLELLSRAVDGLIRRLDFDPNELDELVVGAVMPQTKNPNLARDVVLNLNLPSHIHGYTLNRTCLSGLQAIVDVAKSIRYGQSLFAISGGVECLSDVPLVYSREARRFMVKLTKAKSASAKLNIVKHFSAKAWLPKSPQLAEPLSGLTMAEHAEIMAQKNNIGRERQDAFALSSHQKAKAAQEKKLLAREIIGLWPSPHYEACVDADNLIRPELDALSLSKLPPLHDKRYGTLSAGNASAVSDGAAVALIADKERALAYGLKPRLQIVDFDFVALNPYEKLLLGPALTIPRLLQRNGLERGAIARFELHEAFAAQVLSCLDALDSKRFCRERLGMNKAFGAIDEGRLNVYGGALAIGHPFGASGVRMLTSLAHQLSDAGEEWGVLAMCAAGGMAGSLLVRSI